MKIRNLYKTISFYLCVSFAVLLAAGFFPERPINGKDSPEFSARRVADDIRVISKEPHSIQHPKARKVVRDYLYHRLEQLGGKTQIFEYDSIECKFGGRFNYSNVYAEFSPPAAAGDSVQYVLLVAHYDSRFRHIVGKDTVFSFGAADDGYGIGVILECVSLAAKYAGSWRQGVRVLFTDAEEHGMDGMASALEYNPQVFENVNFVINVEARGVKGPALLFEVSSPNDKLLKLYSSGCEPSGMSLTSVVYSFLPTVTDFTLVRDSIPGLNFAVIDNLKYYHTDKDNYSNISLSSLQHYGNQIAPVLREYLTSEEYSSPKALEGGRDNVFFALPVLGMFAFSKGGYLIFNLLVFALFIFVCVLYVRYKMIRVKRILRALLHVVVFAFGALVAGFAVAYIASVHCGYEFGLLALKYVEYDTRATLAMSMVLVLWVLVFSRLQERKDKCYSWSLLLASNMVLFVYSVVLYVAVGENFFVLFPLASATVAMFFSIARNFKWLYLLSCCFMVLMGVHFLYLLYVALSFGSVGVILNLGAIYTCSIVSQYYCLKRDVL